MSAARDGLGAWLASLGFAAETPFRGLNGTRRFRWDWSRGRVAVEWQGIMGGGPSHLSLKGAARDHQKVSEGQLCGFIVIQCNAMNLDSGDCVRWVELAMEAAT